MSLRLIARIHPAIRDDIADLTTRRPLPSASLSDLDPFLFLNHHGPQIYPQQNRGLPFGPHPHRGFETVTFILAGDIAHRDSAGGESVIDAGGVQWMSAGRGLVHSEVSSDRFKKNGGGLEILQLWVNLPAKLKMIAPSYIGQQRDELTRFTSPDGRSQITLVCGALLGFESYRGTVKTNYPITLALMSCQANAGLQLRLPAAQTVFFYVVSGDVEINGKSVSNFHLIEFEQMPKIEDDQDEVEVRVSSSAVFLVGHARPFKEPIVSHGPFVMNTREEIIAATEDFQSGKLR